MAPVLAMLLRFAVTTNCTVPFPEPDGVDVSTIQGDKVDAVQGHLWSDAEIVMLRGVPPDPRLGMEIVDGVTKNVQTGAGMSLAIAPNWVT